MAKRKAGSGGSKAASVKDVGALLAKLQAGDLSALLGDSPSPFGGNCGCDGIYCPCNMIFSAQDKSDQEQIRQMEIARLQARLKQLQSK